jgi:antitoxin HicB
VTTVSENTNSLDYYLSLDYPIRIYGSADEGYIAGIDELLGCEGYGDTPAAALADLDDFKRAWFVDALNKGRRIPRPTKHAANPPSGRFNLRLPRSLHRALIDQAGTEGVSLNTHVISLLSWAVSAAAPFAAAEPTPAQQKPKRRLG